MSIPSVVLSGTVKGEVGEGWDDSRPGYTKTSTGRTGLTYLLVFQVSV